MRRVARTGEADPDDHTAPPVVLPGLRGALVLLAVAIAAAVLAWHWVPAIPPTLPGWLSTVLGWLPVGGLEVLAGLLLAAADRWPRRPRAVTAAAYLLVAAWLGVALTFIPGRHLGDLRARVGPAGPDLLRAAEWALFTVPVWGLWNLVVSDRDRVQRLSGRWDPSGHLVGLLPVPLLLLGALLLVAR